MINIHSIKFDDTLVHGWHKADDTDRGIGFIDNPKAPSNMIMTDFNPFALPFCIDTDNFSEISQAYKQASNSLRSGLIEIEIASAAGLKMIRAIEKEKQESGMTYKGTLTIPIKNAFFVLRVWCFEVGFTGIRDTLLAAEFMKQGAFDQTKEDWGGWWIDPYKLGQQPLMRNQAEDQRYDDRFPDHPLSRVRRYLTKIENSLDYDPSRPAPRKSQDRSWLKKLFAK